MPKYIITYTSFPCCCQQIEPVIQNHDLVHHLLLYRCPPSVIKPFEGSCYSQESPDCFHAVAVWGVGGGVSDVCHWFYSIQQQDIEIHPNLWDRDRSSDWLQILRLRRFLIIVFDIFRFLNSLRWLDFPWAEMETGSSTDLKCTTTTRRRLQVLYEVQPLFVTYTLRLSENLRISYCCPTTTTICQNYSLIVVLTETHP